MAKGRKFGLVQFSRMGRQMLSTPEKSLARRTLNDAPLPKVNWYISHICFLRHFLVFHLFWFFPTTCLNFENHFLYARIFLEPFSFLQKYQKYFLSFEIHWKIILNIFSEQVLAVHQIFKPSYHWMTIRTKGGTSGPGLGPTDPIGRSTQEQWLLGHTSANGFLTVWTSSLSCARAWTL